MPDTLEPALEAALAPCPFCGEVLEIRSGANPYGRHQQDSECIMAGRAINIPFDVERWNTRAPQAEIDRLREALDELERVRPGAFWLLGKGRTSEKEPLFGFQILFGTDDVLADGEGETAADAIRAAVSRLPPETPNGGQNG